VIVSVALIADNNQRLGRDPKMAEASPADDLEKKLSNTKIAIFYFAEICSFV